MALVQRSKRRVCAHAVPHGCAHPWVSDRLRGLERCGESLSEGARVGVSRQSASRLPPEVAPRRVRRPRETLDPALNSRLGGIHAAHRNIAFSCISDRLLFLSPRTFSAVLLYFARRRAIRSQMIGREQLPRIHVLSSQVPHIHAFLSCCSRLSTEMCTFIR